MKKLIIALVTASFLVGCGDDKFDQEKEMLAMKLAHEREMARIEVSKTQAANQPENVYNIEHEYEMPESNSNYSDSTSSVSQGTMPSAPSTPSASTSTESGYSGTDMILAAGAGALAGYAVSEMLDNGMKSYKDESGKTHYVDSKTGKPVTKEAYENAKKTSNVTKFKESAKNFGNKAKETGKKQLDKAKTKVNDFKQSERGQKISQKASSMKQKAKYQARKAKVIAKKQAKKAKRKLKKK